MAAGKQIRLISGTSVLCGALFIPCQKEVAPVVKELRCKSEENSDWDMTTQRRRREPRSVVGGARKRRLPARVAKADWLVYIATDGLVWVVLFNADQDCEIEGREVVDAEEIDTRKDDWEEEIEAEDEEDVEEAKHVDKSGSSIRLDIPVISWVFELLTGVELTIMNTVTYMMAIPFTIIHKGITNSVPLAGAVSELTPVDEINIAKGVMLIVGGLWSSASNAFVAEVGIAEQSPLFSLLKRIITGLNISLTTIIFGLGGYPTLKDGTPVSALFGSWGLGVLPPCLHIAYCVKFRGTRGPSRDLTGQLIFTLTGAGQLIEAVWQAHLNYRTWTPKTKAAVISLFFLPWQNLCSLLGYLSMELDLVDAQYAIAAQFVINLVSGVGAGSALIASGTISNGTLLNDEQHPRKIEVAEGDEETEEGI